MINVPVSLRLQINRELQMLFRCNRVMPLARTQVGLAVVLMSALWLAGCGGGGGGSDTPATSLAISGTAATSAPLASAAVDSKCTTGAGSATTAGDGSYTVTIVGGALPCVLRVTGGSTVLHSVVTGNGTTARANLTPVTELVVARVAGDLPANYYAGFSAGASAALTPAAAQSASTAVVDTLKAGGVDLTASGDLLVGPLPASGAYATGLAALQTALTASGTTLAALTQAIAVASPAAPVASLSNVASLPAERLFAPAAANCASLRSGKYRFVGNVDGGTAPSTELLTINATALTITNSTNDVFPLVSTGPCAYRNTATGSEFVVGRAGVITARVDADNGAMVGAVLFPEQSHSVAELAGEWNALAFDGGETGVVHPTAATVTIDSLGKLTALTYCDDVRTCVAVTGSNLPVINIRLNVAGGYDLVNTSANYTDRVFAYRAGGGELMWITLATGGHISFATRTAPLVLPVLGRIQENWNVTLTAAYTAPNAISVGRNTVVSLDNSAGSYVRNSLQNAATGATRPETLAINSLREGYVRRVPGPATHSDGTTSTVSEFIALPLRGMDFATVAFPAANQLTLSMTSSIVTP